MALVAVCGFRRSLGTGKSLSFVGPHSCRRESSVKIVGHRSHSCNRLRGGAHCGRALQPWSLPLSSTSLASLPIAERVTTVPSVRSSVWPSRARGDNVPAVASLSSAAAPLLPLPAVPVPSLAHRWVTGVSLACQRRSAGAGVAPALRPSAVSPAPTLVPTHFPAPWQSPQPNPALNLAPFGRWTLRDTAAQRRLALLQGLPHLTQAF